VQSVANIERKEKFVTDFETFSDLYLKNDSMNVLRKNSIQHFAEIGFPTLKNEEWKYTNISPIAKTNFRFTSPSDKLRLTKEEIKDFLLCGNAAIVLVFENGRFNESLSDLTNLPENIIVASLAFSFESETVKQHLGKYASIKTESFIALNTAFVYDGGFIHIAANTIVEQPIHLLYVSDARTEATVAYPRNLIVVENNSRVKIAESFHCIQSANHNFTNSVTEIVVNENALVEFDKIQNETSEAFHINHTEVYQEKNSTFNIATITLGGNIVRNNLHMVLDGVNCTAHLYGLYLLSGNQLVDNHTLVDHAKPNCYSNELYKGIIDGKAQGVFNGKIFVRKDAQKTNAYQNNKNILLSNDATMNAKPQLEIFADDVKCSHGATTGQLDDDALFYLRSRGIGEQNAKALLNFAFASGVVEKINIADLKQNLLKVLATKLNSLIEFETE
jgi:Fe-S cluster assembly protein SufD